MLILNLYFVHFKRIDDLWNKCTNLQKYKSDTELEIRTLLNTIKENETEIETLHKHLARYTIFCSFYFKEEKIIYLLLCLIYETK